MLQFRNTEIAFKHKTNAALKNAYWLFYSFKYIRTLKWIAKLSILLIRIGFPVKWIIKKTLFAQFVGGESISETRNTVALMFSNFKIGSILDYSVEGANEEKQFNFTKDEILRTIEEAKESEAIPFAVFKLSGLTNSKTLMYRNHKDHFEALKTKVNEICSSANRLKVPVLIDAEESWFQNTIDTVVEEMMEKYNREMPIVYHTIQLYRKDKLEYLKSLITSAETKGYFLGVKLVRGAYVEKERNFALENEIDCLIHESKADTDKDYNLGLSLCIDSINKVSTIIATHNEQSVLNSIQRMEELGIQKNDARIFFAQLFGMSDHISLNLINDGFNTVKYLPYGPVKDLMPYLLRRAEENSSIAGQSSRELLLIKHELKRRKSS